MGGNERAGCSGGEAEAESKGPGTEAGAEVECSGERSRCSESWRNELGIGWMLKRLCPPVDFPALL